MKKKTIVTGFKTRIKALESQIRKNNKALELLEKRRENVKILFVRRKRENAARVREFVSLKLRGTKKEKDLKEKILHWQEKGEEILHVRKLSIDDEIRRVKNENFAFKSQLISLQEEEVRKLSSEDDIVDNVFELNRLAVEAAQRRTGYVKDHVFDFLIGEDGKLMTQVTFTSLDGLRRVMAKVNSMTVIKTDLAMDAMSLIDSYFERFEKEVSMDEATREVFELCRGILIEKTEFKVGPNLHMFLGLKLKASIYPELVKAQQLLKISIRYEKSNKYITLYKRKSLTDNWEPVPQS